MTWEDIPGWFNFQDLYDRESRICTDQSILVEVGCWRGRSIAYLANKIKSLGKHPRLVAVDTWKGSPEDEHQRYIEEIGGPDYLYAEFISNIRRCGVKELIEPMCLPSVEAAACFEAGSLDFVFIDACHEYESVVEDLKAWLPKIRKGGCLAGHDILYPSVRKAVSDVLKTWNVFGSCWECHP